MGSLAEVMASDINIIRTKDYQKYLIEFILTYSCYDLISLAEILNVNTLTLSQVARGFIYLDDESALRLLKYFFICIGM